jgi:hypothetical protein
MPDNGFNAAPDRYTGEGRETCDRMRDYLGDEGFAAACASNVIKYTDRRGRKGDAHGDMEKAWWWCRMYLHVQGEADDPRAGRPGFVGYSRPVRRNCWSCRYTIDMGNSTYDCANLYGNVYQWLDSVGVGGHEGLPFGDADGCPGWAAKEDS